MDHTHPLKAGNFTESHIYIIFPLRTVSTAGCRENKNSRHHKQGAAKPMCEPRLTPWVTPKLLSYELPMYNNGTPQYRYLPVPVSFVQHSSYKFYLYVLY